MKIKSKINHIPVTDMQDGQLAIIVLRGPGEINYIGDIVQRYGENLVNVGKSQGDCWQNLFDMNPSKLQDFRVEIIPPGTELIA